MTGEKPSEMAHIESALAIGEAALTALERIVDVLEAARSHGQWDLLTPGFTPKLLKHERPTRRGETQINSGTGGAR